MKYDISKLSPAHLDQKDIMEDALFEQIFDDMNYIENREGTTAVGYITNTPVLLEWKYGSNVMRIIPMGITKPDKEISDKITKVLQQYNDEDCGTLCDVIVECDDFPIEIYASYYFKPE